MKSKIISSFRPLMGMRPSETLPRRHSVRLMRRGGWVQKVLDDGTELSGVLVLGRFDRWRFSAREVTLLEADGHPYTHLGRIPPAQQYLEVAVDEAAPVEVGDRLATFVRRVDPQNRRVELRRDDGAVRQVERLVLWRWRLLRWVRRTVGQRVPVKAS